MKTDIIVQPTRFEIDEEDGCAPDVYSYVGYIIHFVPALIVSLGCVILARKSAHGDDSSNLDYF